MGYVVIVVCTFALLQGAWSVPTPQTPQGADASTGTGTGEGTSTAVSTGAKLAADLNKNAGTILGDLRVGANAVAKPVLSFGFDTIPSIFSSAFKTGTETVGKMAQAKVNAAGQVVSGVSGALGSAGTLASAVVGGGLQGMGHGMGVVGTGLGAGAKLVIDLGGNLGDRVASGITVGGKLANGALGVLGDGLTAASGGARVLPNGAANVMDAIGNRLTLGITNAQKVASDLMDSGAMKPETGAVNLANVNFHELLNSFLQFLQILKNSQSMFDNLTTTISSAGAAAAATKGLRASGRSLDLDGSGGAGLSFNAARSIGGSAGSKRSIGGEVAFGVGGEKSLGLSAKSSVGLDSLDLDTNGSFKLGSPLGLGGKASLEFGHEKSAGAGGKGSVGLKVNAPFGVGGELSIGDFSTSKAGETVSQ